MTKVKSSGTHAQKPVERTHEEQEAILRWVEPAMPTIERICRRIHPTEVEDCVNTVLAHLFSHNGAWPNDHAKRAWLSRVTRNICISYLRAKSSRGWDGIMHIEEGFDLADHRIESDANVRAEFLDIEEAIKGLSFDEQVVTRLKLDGLKIKSMAKELGLEERKVRHILEKIREQLRVSLNLPRTGRT
jgi:RNA polymerase sigma factor (sigma-70 family)